MVLSCIHFWQNQIHSKDKQSNGIQVLCVTWNSSEQNFTFLTAWFFAFEILEMARLHFQVTELLRASSATFA